MLSTPLAPLALLRLPRRHDVPPDVLVVDAARQVALSVEVPVA